MPHIRQRQDYAYWYQLFLNNKGIRYGAVELPLGYYEIRDNSISSNKYKNIIYNFNMFRQELKYNVVLSGIFVFLNIVNWFFKKVFDRLNHK